MIAALRQGLEDSKLNLEKLKNIDLLSLFTLVFGLSTMTYILEEGPKVEWFDSGAIRNCFLIAIICIPLFIVRQLTCERPLLRLSLFSNRNFALGTVITAVAGCALFSGIYSLSLYLAQVQDYSAAEIGRVLMWVGLPQLLVMPLLPVLMKRVDMRSLAVFGLLLFAYSNFMNTNLNINFSGEELKISLWVRALGQPSFGIALTTTFLITQQSGHLIQMSGRLSAFNNSLIEKFYLSEQNWKSLGLDAAAARRQAAKQFVDPLVRDSVILSFVDIFMVLAIALVGCAIIVLFLRKTEHRDGAAETH